MSDGDEIILGDVTLTAYIVPLHSLCVLTMYGKIGDRNCLFSGDAIFIGGEMLLQSFYDVSILPCFVGAKNCGAGYRLPLPGTRSVCPF